MSALAASLRPTLRRSLVAPAAHRHQQRSFARVTVIGPLIEDAKVLTSGSKEFVALKVGSSDPQSKAAREAGDKSTLSVFDALCFTESRIPYLSGFKKGSLVHIEADVKMQVQRDAEGNYASTVPRFTIQDVTKLRNPTGSSE